MFDYIAMVHMTKREIYSWPWSLSYQWYLHILSNILGAALPSQTYSKNGNRMNEIVDNRFQTYKNHLLLDINSHTKHHSNHNYLLPMASLKALGDYDLQVSMNLHGWAFTLSFHMLDSNHLYNRHDYGSISPCL